MAKTILAVDDSASLRQMVAFTLKTSGYEVVEAVDGEDGLSKAKAAVFDLVLRIRTCLGWMGWNSSRICVRYPSTKLRQFLC
jgi:DNA-binding response OmpR family regulator